MSWENPYTFEFIRTGVRSSFRSRRKRTPGVSSVDFVFPALHGAGCVETKYGQKGSRGRSPKTELWVDVGPGYHRFAPRYSQARETDTAHVSGRRQFRKEWLYQMMPFSKAAVFRGKRNFPGDVLQIDLLGPLLQTTRSRLMHYAEGVLQSVPPHRGFRVELPQGVADKRGPNPRPSSDSHREFAPSTGVVGVVIFRT